MPGAKVRRIDFYPDDWLAGTRGMTEAEKGAYWDICSLIYATGGPVSIDRARKTFVSKHFNRILARLIAMGKVTSDGHQLSVDRALKELCRGFDRVLIGRSAAAKRWENKETAAPEHMPTTNIQQCISRKVGDSDNLLSPTFNFHNSTNNALRARAREPRLLVEKDFSAWWEKYPHKVGKGAARKAFQTALKKTTADVLAVGVERYTAAKPADRPWCNPATWLNQERWNDVFDAGHSEVSIDRAREIAEREALRVKLDDFYH